MMFRHWSLGVAALAIALHTAVAAGQIAIPTVPIGNPGNGPDPVTGLGSVGYRYNIGQTEVTNAQYVAFLNAVARTDVFGLYDPNMSGTFGGITRAGSPGAFTYSTIEGREHSPVNFVTFWDAARFANWLHNGRRVGEQTAATTEGGAYTLTAAGMNANSVTRNAAWRWAVASDNEWYKAAYFAPDTQSGEGGRYWRFPTSRDIAPQIGEANMSFGVQGGFNRPIPVGAYWPNAAGTQDMAGNVWEWTEDIVSPSSRRMRGGAYNSSGSMSESTLAIGQVVWNPTASSGFRVVQIPAPPSAMLLALSGLIAARRRR